MTDRLELDYSIRFRDIGKCFAVFALFILCTLPTHGQANVTGQWQTLPTQMPINPVHLSLLHNGQVLIVSGSGSFPSDYTYLAAVWNPQTDTVTTQPVPYDMFCNGMVELPDGRPFILSGTLQYSPPTFFGTPLTGTYDPATGNFYELQPMAHGRWYPTATTLGNGKVMVFGGSDENGLDNNTVEIYTVGSGWSQPYQASFYPPFYPRMHLLPNGTVFNSGSQPNSFIFNPATQTWTSSATTNYPGTRTYGTSVLLPLTPANSYDPKVMIMGGGSPATATTEIIDLGASQPQWVYGPSMSEPRIEMDAVILPTGNILALNGSQTDEDANTASLNADLYNPTSNTFSSAGAGSYARLYHSGALLLPNATVLVVGGNPERGTYEPHMEIYSPPYLFNSDGSLATQPTITSVTPGVIGYGASFQIQTPNAANISSVVLVRPGSPTHAFDMDQRLVGINFTAGSGVLNATAPPNGNIAPPGYYMVFVINSAGVPSVAQFVQLSLEPTDQPPSGQITVPSGNVTINAGQSVSFAGTGTSPDSTIAAYSWVFPGGSPATSSLASPGAVTYSSAPVITALSPTFGTVGTAVTITASSTTSYAASLTVTDSLGVNDPSPPIRTITVATGFGATQGTSTVTFNGVPATPTSWTSTSITAPVPTDASVGNVVVTVGGAASNGAYFEVLPTITSLSPSAGPVGTAVTITGTGFGLPEPAGSYVVFNGTVGAVTSWSATSIVATVPAGATTGNVVVVAGGQGGNGVSFTVGSSSGPSISSLSPTSGTVGAQVTIAGTNFGSSGTVTFNGTTATTSSWNSTTIVTSVPSGATTGNVMVTVGGVASNGVNFTVSPSGGGGIKLVQHTSVDAGTTSTASLAFPGNNTLGNWIGVCIRAGQPNETITVKDFNGNTYHQATQINQTGDGDTLAIFYAENIKGGANTVTVSDSITDSLRFAILEYSGVATSGSIDVATANQGSNASPNSGSVTTTANGDLLLGAIMTADPETFTAGSGFQIEESAPAEPNTKLIAEDQIQVLGGSTSSSATLSSADPWAAAVASFKSAAAGTAAPAITSANSTTFTVGSAGSFTVTTTGSPTPALSESGSLPSAVTFTNNGNGTATIAGTPASGTAGTYSITITASNGVGSAATQTFTLTVNSVSTAPTITSANSTTFTVGSAGSFTVTTTGSPTPSLTKSGTLPSAVTFTNNGNGTATIAGTPASGTAGTYSITITASNGVGSAATQTFTLTVNQAPAITSANSTTFTVGSAGSFTVTTTGSPTPSLTKSGTLPSAVTFTNNGNGTATIAGTPASGTAGTYSITITASNGVGSAATQTFTLTVNQAPAITSANSTTFTVGSAGSFTVTTTGSPTPSLTKSGTLPSAVTFTNNGNGTATIAGTPASGTAGTYSITITASNGVGSAATQTFTLTVTSGSGGGGIKLVQHTSVDAGTTSTASLAFPGNNTLGNWIGVCIRAGQPNETITVKDFNGNTYHQATQINQTGDGDTLAIFYAENIKGGANTVTVSDSITDSLRFAILEYSGVATSGSIDVATANQGSNASPNSGSVTTTANGDLLLGAIMTADPETFTAGSGFQIEESAPAEPNTKLIAEDQIQVLGGSTSSSATLSSADPWAAAVASFKSAAAGTAAPAITSANSTTFTVGSAGSFTVTTTGSPTPALSESGSLPSAVTFTNNGNGTATIAGTPASGTAGTYSITITASNGVGTAATQTFTLTVTSGGGGTLSQVQSVTCTVTSTGTCSFSTTVAASNAYLFSCSIPTTSQPVAGQITTVTSNGTSVGTVIPTPSSFIVGYPDGTGRQMLRAYVLPSTAVGGSTNPIILTMSPVNTPTLGHCLLAEYHPSANPSQVGLDIDTAVMPQVAAANLSDLAVTLSGTGNEGIVKDFQSGSNDVIPTAVSSPYNTNFSPGGSNSDSAVSSALTSSGAAATWTNTSVVATLGTLALGYNTTSCTEQTFINFSGSGATSGNTPTQTDLSASIQGFNGWYIGTFSIGSLVYNTAARMPLLNTVSRLCDGSTATSGAGTNGVSLTWSGSPSQQGMFTFETPASVIPVLNTSFWFNETFAANDESIYYPFQIYGTTDNTVVEVTGTGTTRELVFDTEEGTVGAIAFTAATQCPCRIATTYAVGNGTTGGTHTLKMYDKTNTQIGSTISHVGLATIDYPKMIFFGLDAASTMTVGKITYLDSLQISLTGAVPGG